MSPSPAGSTFTSGCPASSDVCSAVSSVVAGLRRAKGWRPAAGTNAPPATSARPMSIARGERLSILSVSPQNACALCASPPACRASGLFHRTVQAELLDPVSHLVAVDPQKPGRVRLIAVGPLQRLHQELTLDLLEVHAVGRQVEAGVRGSGPGQHPEVL